MLPILEDFIQRFKLDDFVIVADSGLMNKSNITLLKKQGYKYIIGARIKNESREIKEWILSQEMSSGMFKERTKFGNRLIIGYSKKRARSEERRVGKSVDIGGRRSE